MTIILNNIERFTFGNKLFVIGDIHSNFEFLIDWLTKFSPTNACIFLAGDVGIGFSPTFEKRYIDKIEKILEELDSYIIAIRGNHDNPRYFDTYFFNKRFKTVPDYTIIEAGSETFLCIGGAVSVDRKMRTVNSSWWEGEGVKREFDQLTMDEINSITGVIAHCSPTFCPPLKTSPTLEYYSSLDSELLKDIERERAYLDEVFTQLKSHAPNFKYWIQGHYHFSSRDCILGIKVYTLNVSEVYTLDELPNSEI